MASIEFDQKIKQAVLIRQKKCDRWTLRIPVNGKRIYLGPYENEIDAAKAYDVAAKQYYGDFAVLNFDK